MEVIHIVLITFIARNFFYIFPERIKVFADVRLKLSFFWRMLLKTCFWQRAHLLLLNQSIKNGGFWLVVKVVLLQGESD